MNSYQDPTTAIKYLDFLNSKNGQIQKTTLEDAIRSRLGTNNQLMILDAGCGPGWLAGALKKDFNDVRGCDASEFFIRLARANSPGVDFKVAAMEKLLPYEKNYFDAVILNMVAPDLADLRAGFENLSAAMKPGAKLLMTVPNPKYTYPAAEWKRSLADVLFGRKPKLKIKTPPISGSKIQREFGNGVTIDSYFYTLDDYQKNAANARLKLTATDEIRSRTDSQVFDLNYQLYHYPLFLLLEFKKI